MPNEDAPTKIRSIALTGLFILACFYTLDFARAVILPVILALLFTFLLRPFVRGLKKIKIPDPLGSALILIILLGGIGYGMFQLSGPASGWMNNAPERGNLRSEYVENGIL